jgi:hypothetical protein
MHSKQNPYILVVSHSRYKHNLLREYKKKNRERKRKFGNLLFSSLRQLNILQIKPLRFNCKIS